MTAQLAQDMPNHVGDTPLICAARLNRAALVEYLLEKNADPSLENEHKITAQFLAKELGFDRIVALCETWTVKRNQRGGFA
jgi:ankyrin repeat protein